jgi:hypothetical protein
MADLSPLRRRMIEDMTVRNLSPATQRSYIHAVSKFSRYFGKSPDRLELEDVRAFQVHLVSTGISWPALNQIVCALRFFYGVTLGEALIPERIPYERRVASPHAGDFVRRGLRLRRSGRSMTGILPMSCRTASQSTHDRATSAIDTRLTIRGVAVKWAAI